MRTRTFFLTIALLGVLPASAAQAQPERDAPAKAESDSGRRGHQPLVFDLRGGYQFLDLTTFTASEREFSADLVPTTAQGPTGQLGAGIMAFGLHLGARGSVTSLQQTSNGSNFHGATLWSLDAELGFHLATGGALDPFFFIGAGYTGIGGLPLRSVDAEVTARGYNARAGLGVDYFVSQNVALGVTAAGEVLFMTRPGVSTADLLTPEQVETVGEAKARVLEADGSTVGTAVSFTAGPSFHF